MAGLTSCVQEGPSSSIEGGSQENSSVEYVDYVKETHLNYQYKDKQFLKDGVGEVTLVTKVDGDTAHFKQVSGDTGTIKGRYNCIDTPESTGMLEPWGKGASNFNGDYLAKAKHIVLTTDVADNDGQGKPVLDSTGGRYLVYVWVTEVENPTIDDFINLNLALCQEGYSKAKGVTGKEYADAFTNAAVQAQALKLHLWSDEKDPDYNYANPVKIDLRMICEGYDSEGKNLIGSVAKLLLKRMSQALVLIKEPPMFVMTYLGRTLLENIPNAMACMSSPNILFTNLCKPSEIS